MLKSRYNDKVVEVPIKGTVIPLFLLKKEYINRNTVYI